MYNESLREFEELFCVVTGPSCSLDIFKNKNIMLYGAGYIGGLVYDALNENNQKVSAFIDRRGIDGMLYKTKPVYNLSDLCLTKDLIDNTVIILSFNTQQEDEIKTVKMQLNEFGFTYILHYKEFATYLYHPQDIRKEKNKIISFAGMLDEELSIHILYQFILAKLTGDFDQFCLPSDEPQYFVKSILFNKGYERFIDCGAYIGDSIILGLKNNCNIRSVVCFEPDEKNFTQLSDNIHAYENINSAVCFPCGVSDRSETVHFSNTGTQGACITETGSNMIQCVSIDQALKGFHPTFIKMDIEGAEKKAIIGASKTIVEDKPDLAISVYHKIEDIWELPLLIHSIMPDYKFYLRCHGLYGTDTVLYATISE